MMQDEFTKALSKLSSAGIKAISNFIKHLIDIERPSEESAFFKQDVIDLIEDNIIELLKDSTKGEEFEKKKRQIQTEFCKVTGKTPPASEEEKKS